MDSYLPPIGIAGAARAGKDTLCQILIQLIKRDYSIYGVRRSVAGDFIKADILALLTQNNDRAIINPFTQEEAEKELIRPLLVEYGRLLRNCTKGRFFVDRLEMDIKKSVGISIIPDIRYAEYEQDEVFWLKREMNGLLVFVEREDIKSANSYEYSNNLKIKEAADIIISWETVNEDVLQSKMLEHHAKTVVNAYTRILPLADRTLFRS